MINSVNLTTAALNPQRSAVLLPSSSKESALVAQVKPSFTAPECEFAALTNTPHETVNYYYPQALAADGLISDIQQQELLAKLSIAQLSANAQLSSSAQLSAITPLNVAPSDPATDSAATGGVHNSQSAKPPESDELSLVAIIMWMLEELLPQLMLVMTNLNQNLNDLTVNNYILELANAQVGLEYSLNANAQLKASALLSFSSELTGASMDLTSGSMGFFSTYHNRLDAVEDFRDAQQAFGHLQTGQSSLQQQLAPKEQRSANVDLLANFLTAEQRAAQTSEVEAVEQNLRPQSEQQRQKLAELEPHALTGEISHVNLRRDVAKIKPPKLEHSKAMLAQMKSPPPPSKLSYVDIGAERPKYSKDSFDNAQNIAQQLQAAAVQAGSPPLSETQLNTFFSQGALRVDLPNGRSALVAILADEQQNLGVFACLYGSNLAVPQLISVVPQITANQLGLAASFASGVAYSSEALGAIKDTYRSVTPDLVPPNLQDTYRVYHSRGDLLASAPEQSGVLAGGRFNLLTPQQIVLLDADYVNNGRVQLMRPNAAGTQLELSSTLVIPVGAMRNNFATEYHAAETFMLSHLEHHLAAAPLINLYMNANPGAPLTLQLRENLPATLLRASLAQVELNLSQEYVTEASNYLNQGGKSVKIIQSKLDARRVLIESFLRISGSVSQLSTAGMHLSSKNQDANARLLESFGQVIERMNALMSKTNDSYADEFARFIKALSDAMIQQLTASSQLLTRFYSNR